jgi:hypothetical protein
LNLVQLSGRKLACKRAAYGCELPAGCTRGEEPSAQDYEEAAALLAYCALGREVFSAENDVLAVSAAEHRIEAALEAGEGFDASLILLALHAGIIHPGVKESFQLESV